METYVYPYEEFFRDLDAVLPPPNAQPRGFGYDMAVIREYLRKTYPDRRDSNEREVALGMIMTFILKNMAAFDTGNIAVRGSEKALISEFLLRAAHTLICPYVFGETERFPETDEVLALAETYANEKARSSC